MIALLSLKTVIALILALTVLVTVITVHSTVTGAIHPDTGVSTVNSA